MLLQCSICHCWEIGRTQGISSCSHGLCAAVTSWEAMQSEILCLSEIWRFFLAYNFSYWLQSIMFSKEVRLSRNSLKNYLPTFLWPHSSWYYTDRIEDTTLICSSVFCVCVCWHRKLFTEQWPSNVRGGHTNTRTAKWSITSSFIFSKWGNYSKIFRIYFPFSHKEMIGVQCSSLNTMCVYAW